MRIEFHNLDGNGKKRCHVYDMPPVANDYWAAVTDVPCPCCKYGIIRWAEAGYVPGYRICSVCNRHFLAKGDSNCPKLIRFGQRRSKAG